MIIGADRIKTSGGDVLEGELATVADVIASVTTTATPASGTCGVQFVFKNQAGNPVSSKRSMGMWLSDVNGAPVAAITSLAALVNGNLDSETAGKRAAVQTTAAGLLGVTLTGAAATYYLSWRLPNGTLLTSGPLTIN